MHEYRAVYNIYVACYGNAVYSCMYAGAAAILLVHFVVTIQLVIFESWNFRGHMRSLTGFFFFLIFKGSDIIDNFRGLW